MKIYGIYGTFFQEYEEPVIVQRSETEGGAAVALIPQAMAWVFSGHFAMDENGGEGNMIDCYGPSTILVSKLTPTEMSFSKTYLRTGNIVHYYCQRTGCGMWVGVYWSNRIEPGKVRFRLCKLEPALFTPEDDFAKAARLLEKYVPT